MTYQCTKCRRRFCIMTDLGNHLLDKNMPCPTYGCKGKQIQMAADDQKAPRERVGAMAFYQACMGQGLPEERKCTPTAVRKLLKGAKIADVDLVKTAHGERSLVLAIELENGKVLHLGSSPSGAVAYKITEAP